MMADSSVSQAVDLGVFRLASQRSEIKRLLLVLGIMGALFVLTLVRYFIGGDVIYGQISCNAFVVFLFTAFYVLGFLLFVHRANLRKKLLPAWAGGVGVILEALFPTFILLVIVKLSAIDPLQALAAPALLLYGIFAAANVLRLSPKLSLLFGVIAAGGHAGVSVYAVAKEGGVEWAMIPFLGSYAMLLLLTGVVTAFVSRELRNHAVAALQAADLRRRAELLQSELRIAREIQQTLFPREALNIPGFEVIGWCKPATETGGDYYDWCRLPSKEGFVMLGDATGHGLGPSLLITSCRAYVRADLPHDNDLVGFMNRLNARLSGDLNGSRFVTFVGILLDEKTGQARMISAGHCPVLVVRAAGPTVEEVKAHGMPLGIAPEQLFSDSTSVCLRAGDRLVVYTDGMTEAKGPDGSEFGLDRLTQSVIRHSLLEGQPFIDALYRDLKNHTGNAVLQDDLTLISVRRLK